VTLRPATGDDREAVVDMCVRFFASSIYRYLGTPDEERIAVLFELSRTHGVVLVADDGGTLQGFLSLIALEHPISGERYAAEQAWWVEPAARDSRVGPDLLEAGEEWCRSNSIHMIQMVAPTGTRVGRFYERWGYQSLETAYFKRL